jgi:hypothetical protein
MFDEPQTTNTGMDQVAEEITGQVQNFGLGHNPSLVSPTTTPTNSAPTQPEPTSDQSSTTPINDAPAVSPSSPAPALPTDLANIQKEAIEQLMPLVNKLDQTPEDRFKTLMMVIQASDDQGLIKEAYAAANAITDEKVRAEALLSVVNEINYFANKQS